MITNVIGHGRNLPLWPIKSGPEFWQQSARRIDLIGADGFYSRDCHISLIREGRLIAGVNHLSELPPKLRQAVLLIEDKVPSGTTMQDAETLAEYAGFVPGTVGFRDYVQSAVA